MVTQYIFDATDSGPMQAGHSAAGSKDVLALVGAGRNKPGGGEETGGGVNDKIGDGVGGGVGRTTKRGHGRRVGVPDIKRVKWSGIEQCGGQMSDQPRQSTGQEHRGEGQIRKQKPKLRWTESSTLLDAVLGWNYTTHY